MSALLIRAKMVVCATQKKANLLFANVQVATLVITVSNVKVRNKPQKLPKKTAQKFQNLVSP